MAKEKIKYIDDTEVEVEINRLGFRKATQIAKRHIPIDALTINKQTDEITVKGNIDLIGMSESCLETIEGLNLDKIDGETAKDLFKRYFEKDVMAGLGQGGNPN